MKRNILRPAACATMILGCLSVAGGAHADIAPPMEPPKPEQVRPATTGSAATPVGIAVTTAPTPAGKTAPDPALATFVTDQLRAMVKDAATLVVIDASSVAEPPATDNPLAAKNLALEPPATRYTVNVEIGGTMADPIVGKGYLPVRLSVSQGERVLGEQRFQVVPREREAATAAFRAFLGKYLPLPGTAPLIATDPKAPPVLRVWMQSSDGDAVRLSSQVAVYWQASHNGYVSLYHHGASGTLQRVFPTAGQPGNFVEAGQIYRFPAEGYLTFAGQPGPESFRAILTLPPTNTPRTLPDGLSFKGEPLRIIPVTHPMLFANEDLSRIFAMPPALFTESTIAYTLKP